MLRRISICVCGPWGRSPPDCSSWKHLGPEVDSSSPDPLSLSLLPQLILYFMIIQATDTTDLTDAHILYRFILVLILLYYFKQIHIICSLVFPLLFEQSANKINFIYQSFIMSACS